MTTMKFKDGAQKVEMMKLSVSSVKTYDQCPKKYYFRYIAKEPTKAWDHFDVGNACHKTLEIFHKLYMKDPNKPLSILMSAAFQKARKDFPKLSDELLSEVKQMIQWYLEYVSKNKMPNVNGVETPFSFKLRDDLLIRGVLDRIDVMDDGRLHVVDYKTTKNVKYLDSFQLLVYGLWLKREYPDLESFKASFVLLKHKSKLKSYDFNLEDINKCEKQLIDYANKINGSTMEDSWIAVPSNLCNFCDYIKICPTQQGW